MRTRLARIALGLLAEPGSRDLGELVAQVGPVAALDRILAGDAPQRLLGQVRTRLGDHNPYALAEDALERAARLGARIVTPEDDEWPRQLDDLMRISLNVADTVARDTYPPHCLWLRGQWPLAEACDRSVAVVGARASTPYGNLVAGDIAYGLAHQGWTVVSGGAFGIDAAAHRGALAASGCTIAVLACGIDRPYPASHTSLFERIADEGLLVSEWPPGCDPHRHRFLVRNRLIAAITRGTVVVEAGLRSGARFTLHRARHLGRPALVVPGPVTSAMSEGCHEELRVENTILVSRTEHIIDAVGRVGDDLAPERRAEENPRDRLTTLQRQVLDGVRPRKPRTAEEIAAAVGVSTRDARRTLPSLEQAGFVVREGATYRLAPAARHTTTPSSDQGHHLMTTPPSARKQLSDDDT